MAVDAAGEVERVGTLLVGMTEGTHAHPAPAAPRMAADPPRRLPADTSAEHTRLALGDNEHGLRRLRVDVPDARPLSCRAPLAALAAGAMTPRENAHAMSTAARRVRAARSPHSDIQMLIALPVITTLP